MSGKVNHNKPDLQSPLANLGLEIIHKVTVLGENMSFKSFLLVSAYFLCKIRFTECEIGCNFFICFISPFTDLQYKVDSVYDVIFTRQNFIDINIFLPQLRTLISASTG